MNRHTNSEETRNVSTDTKCLVRSLLQVPPHATEMDGTEAAGAEEDPNKTRKR